MFDSLSDDILVDAYLKAIELDLEKDFIHLLENALACRGLCIPR
ncbi:sporulation histidine kinase inhibitor Sda [Virgibacillus senegalensis]|nr:sporulation histidine kinase inhibitor Sda [Virgibacillus senegalensis]